VECLVAGEGAQLDLAVEVAQAESTEEEHEHGGEPEQQVAEKIETGAAAGGRAVGGGRRFTVADEGRIEHGAELA